MAFFSELQTKIKNINSTHFISGVNASQWFYLSKDFVTETPINIYLFSTEKSAQQASLAQNGIYYPGLAHSPYSSVIPSESDLEVRIKVLGEITKDHPVHIFCSYQALFLLSVGEDYFKELSPIKISQDDIISPKDLSEKLISLGYQFSSQIFEPGDFSKRGEIFDIYPFSHAPVRLQYFDDLIESIFEIDLDTQRTNREKKIESLLIEKTPRIFSQNHFIKNFREFYKRPPLKYAHLNQLRDQIFEDLSQGQLFTSYSLYAHFFTQRKMSLYDYIKNKSHMITVFNDYQCLSNNDLLSDELNAQYLNNLENLETEIPIFPPEDFYKFEELKSMRAINEVRIDTLEDDLTSHTMLDLVPTLPMYSGSTGNLTHSKPQNRFQFLKNISDVIKKLPESTHIVLLIKYSFTKDEITQNFINDGMSLEFVSKIHIERNFVCDGFYSEQHKLFVVSESDFTAKKTITPKRAAQISSDFFTEQISQLKVGDYVIHSEFGVGRYAGLEKISFGENESDYLVIHYSENDKIYVPVYKINLVQKHSESVTEIKLDSLRSKKFLLAKQKARNSAKELAFDLIELQAKREMQKGFSFSISGDDFKQFELDFPFEETPDQASAISKVISDMEKDNPMDRLICGDVGFGKTEVAMRAAFKAVLDGKQVAVLVPTTILSLQHYNSFIRRFKNFPVTINYLSRLKTPKESKEITQQLAEGKIDIIIGTHKLLSSEIKYNDLGLVIIDEEHRFGVAHKEKLKLLKATVDILTLTATPIPRTLQLAQMGLRDISIIQTPPPKRQSVKTFLIRNDVATIQEAILREIKRGGQVYYIHNRVGDIESIHQKIKKMAPDANVIIAHGQLPERELEKRIHKFYQGEAQVLLATTIVESGIDIPTANTMIINKADKFGLAQLHQLRGRIGRSDRKAYAYLVIDQNKQLTDIATKRLKALQTFSEMGSGFSIASSDLDIRGAGNILGGEQSGHISSIGLELYLELLQEAIAEIKGKHETSIQNIEIQTYFPSYIPSKDISDHGQRLKYYKRLSRCQNIDEVANIKDEIQDLYGQLANETLNLVSVFETRLIAQKLHLSSLKISKNNIILKFDQKVIAEYPENRDKLLAYFLSRPNTFKVKPDFSVNCTIKDIVDRNTMTQFVTSIAEQI